MSEYIVNLLPLHEGEAEEFQAIAPDAVHVYARSGTVTPYKHRELTSET